MRIWSLHPQYLDSKGLVALWRETLLAKNVLEGNTRGYTQHPQLLRFKEHENSIAAIHFYLKIVYYEAQKRLYQFDKQKFIDIDTVSTIFVTQGQIEFEIEHLKKKLYIRDPAKYEIIKTIDLFRVHPLFDVKAGEVEVWEKL